LSELSEDTANRPPAANRPPVAQQQPTADASLLALIANGLLAVFVVEVLFKAVPLQILSPAWQLRMVGVITANGAVAITGFGLLHLAANLQPLNQRLADRRRFVRRWALVAALGFLLLVPVQGYAVWNGISITRAVQLRQRNGANQAIERVRQVVARATSLPELQQQLAAVQGPTLTANALQRPLPEVKLALLKEADRVQQQLRQQPVGPNGVDLWSLMQDNLRTVLLAVIFAIAFAGGSQLPGSQSVSSVPGVSSMEDPSLLTELRRAIKRGWRRLGSGPRANSGMTGVGLDEELKFRQRPGKVLGLRLPKLGFNKSKARKWGPGGRR